MKKNISKPFLLAAFFTFSIIFSRTTIGTDICPCCCPNVCECPCESRFCYDCVKPCECRAIHPCHGAPFLQYRSQSLNKAKELVGWQPFTHRYGRDDTYGSLYSSIEFTSSFRSGWIAQYLFGDDLVDGQTLIVQGSQVENRHPKAWLADYLGLPIDFESTVNFCPQIKNIIVDLNTYFGLDRVVKGLYLKFHFPIASTRWELNMSECVKVKGQESFPLGYMSNGTAVDGLPAPFPRSFLPTNFIDAMQMGTTFEDQRSSMLFGTMPCAQLKKTRFSDIRATFGYDFILKKDYTLGSSLQIVFPTGNRPNARYLFEPIVGNGKHWELGLGLNSSWVFWRSSENENRHAGIWLDAVVSHMFKACQARSFDFCGKPNSRYMLLLEMLKNEDFGGADLFGTETDKVESFADQGSGVILDDTDGGATNVIPNYANYIYALFEVDGRSVSGLTPAINYNTRMVDVRVDVQADIAIKFAYVGQDFSFDAGYNFWARTREKITPCKEYCLNEPKERYVIKGDSTIWAYGRGFIQVGSNRYAQPFILPLSGSQCKADIHAGQNMKLQATDPDAAARNMGVDNPEFAWFFVEEGAAGNAQDWYLQLISMENDIIPFSPIQPLPDDSQLYSSFNPRLITPQDLDTCQSASAITHKVFVHMNYEWRDKEGKWRPFAGLGGEVEFAPRTRKHRAISQWGIWLKAGAAFQ